MQSILSKITQMNAPKRTQSIYAKRNSHHSYVYFQEETKERSVRADAGEYLCAATKEGVFAGTDRGGV